MEQPTTGKALSVPSGRAKPSLVLLGDRYISSDGRWHTELAGDYMQANGRKKPVSVGELAKVFHAANTTKNKKKVRKRVAELFRHLLQHGELMVRQVSELASSPYAAVQAVKIYDPASPADQDNIRHTIEWMRARHELTRDAFNQAEELLKLKE